MPDSVIKVDNISSLTGNAVNVTSGVTIPDGSVSNPSIKFTNDGDTGLYRIGANTIGVASSGRRVGEIGNGYGGFTGNIIQVVNSEIGHTQTTTNNANWSTDVLSAVGTPWEIPITPRYVSSKVKIQLLLCAVVSISSTSAYFGVSIWRKIGAGSYTQIQVPTTDTNGSYEFGMGIGNATSATLYSNFPKLFVDTPNTTDLVTYKFSVRTYTSSVALTINIATTPVPGRSYCVIEEIQQ